MKKESSGAGVTLMKTKNSRAGAMFMKGSSGAGAVSFSQRLHTPDQNTVERHYSAFFPLVCRPHKQME